MFLLGREALYLESSKREELTWKERNRFDFEELAKKEPV